MAINQGNLKTNWAFMTSLNHYSRILAEWASDVCHELANGRTEISADPLTENSADSYVAALWVSIAYDRDGGPGLLIHLHAVLRALLAGSDAYTCLLAFSEWKFFSFLIAYSLTHDLKDKYSNSICLILKFFETIVHAAMAVKSYISNTQS